MKKTYEEMEQRNMEIVDKALDEFMRLHDLTDEEMKEKNRNSALDCMQVEFEYEMSEEELLETYVDWFTNGLEYWEE